jgi:tRNA(Arg) A34 adenosine deaminase TadA
MNFMDFDRSRGRRFFLQGSVLALFELLSPGIEILQAKQTPGSERTIYNPFMQKAINLAEENVKTGKGGPFGAVIVKDGRIIATSSNQVTSLNDPTAHAEIMVIRKACSRLERFQLKDCELYTSCEPCPMCLGAIYWTRFTRVYYASSREDAAKAGFDDSFIYQQVELPIDKRSLKMIQVMHDQASKPFDEWARKISKIKY